MRTDVLAGPSPWAVDRLGAGVATRLWTAIPKALGSAVARAVNAPGASRMTTDHAFADARWPLPYEELATHLQGIDGAVLVHPPRTSYQLVLVRNHVVLPWCYGRTGAISMRDARPGRSFGRLARDLLHRFGPPAHRPQPAPPFPRDEADERDVAQVGDALGRLDPSPGILIAGYACTSEYGLLRVCLGEAGLGDGERLHWHHADDLPLPPPAIPRPRRQRFP
jgi:hypothetical protein